MQGFRFFDCSIVIVLILEFGYGIVILKVAILDKVDYIKIELALALQWYKPCYIIDITGAPST